MTHYGPNLVTDGLAFFMDPNNVKSYSGSGTSVTDFINGHTGTLYNGVTHTSEGFVLDQTAEQYISFPHIDAYNMETGWTLSLWTKRTGAADSGGFSKFFSKWENYFIAIDDSSDTLYAGVGTGSGYTTNGGDRNVTMGLDEWVYITCAFDETSDSCELYQNMSLAHTISATSTGGSSNHDLNFGIQYASVTPKDQCYDGIIGMATIHNRKLTTAEMTHNYNIGAKRYLV